MVERRLIDRTNDDDKSRWGVLSALLCGALLGLLVAIPYEQVIGLSGAAGTVLRSLAATVILTNLGIARTSEFDFDPDSVLEREPASPVAREKKVLAHHCQDFFGTKNRCAAS